MKKILWALLIFLLVLFIYLDCDKLRDFTLLLMIIAILIDLFINSKPPKDSDPLYTEEPALGI